MDIQLHFSTPSGIFYLIKHMDNFVLTHRTVLVRRDFFFPRMSHAIFNSSYKTGKCITVKFCLRYGKGMLLERSLKVLLDVNQT